MRAPLLLRANRRTPNLLARCGGCQTQVTHEFWIHTERVKRLPAPIEFVFNTPSHHRVHHGANEAYLDRNYGGMARDVRAATNWRDRVGYVFRGPDWSPDGSGGGTRG
ncbi:MAG: hypothetical protein QOF85_400 [Solirubrobacterales bacterium]|jgi:hypothetical protein|nr:hypothetical protein [Solirubrobacterales bacterium]